MLIFGGLRAFQVAMEAVPSKESEIYCWLKLHAPVARFLQIHRRIFMAHRTCGMLRIICFANIGTFIKFSEPNSV